MTVIVGRRGGVRSGLPGDPLDWLLDVTRGQVLRLPDGNAGEYDPLRGYSDRDRRRLAGAGLVARGCGAPADVLLHDVQASPLCPARLADANPDEFVSWFVDTALAGLDHRRAGGGLEVEPEPEPEPEPESDEGGTVADGAPWPAWLEEWLGRLVFGPKRDLLAALAVAFYCETPWPAVPDTDWALKLVVRFERRAGCTVPR